MELIRIMIDSAIEKKLASKDWRKVEAEPGSPFLGIPGGGGVKSVYQRTWWPMLVRMVLQDLLFMAFIVGVLAVAFFLNDLDSGLDPAYTLWVQLGLLAASLVMAFFLGKRMLAGLSIRTPRRVAVLNRGLAWLDAETLYYWPWEQLKAVRIVGYSLVIENKSGQAARFHGGLYNTEFGQQAQMACYLRLG